MGLPYGPIKRAGKLSLWWYKTLEEMQKNVFPRCHNSSTKHLRKRILEDLNINETRGKSFISYQFHCLHEYPTHEIILHLDLPNIHFHNLHIFFPVKSVYLFCHLWLSHINLLLYNIIFTDNINLNYENGWIPYLFPTVHFSSQFFFQNNNNISNDAMLLRNMQKYDHI